MSTMNQTPRSDRIHIALFGRRNVGKSSVINALTKQEISIVSDVKGTTTDPVYKAMEILPLGPVVIIDTPGLDDEGTLGELRVQRTYDVLNKTGLRNFGCGCEPDARKMGGRGDPQNSGKENSHGLRR